jgi:hypothetical protein
MRVVVVSFRLMNTSLSSSKSDRVSRSCVVIIGLRCVLLQLFVGMRGDGGSVKKANSSIDNDGWYSKHD